MMEYHGVLFYQDQRLSSNGEFLVWVGGSDYWNSLMNGILAYKLP